MAKGYLRKPGEPRPIALTSQEVAITFWCVALIFAAVFIYMLPIRIIDEDTNVMFYAYPMESIGFVFFMIFFFTFFGIAWMNWSHSKNNLNMWSDRIHPDWQGVIRADKNGLVTNQIMKKDSLGLLKGIVFGKKAAAINKRSFNLKLPNGNSVVIVLDFMSSTVDLREALGWSLYKKRHKLLGYDAYVRCKQEKKTLLTTTEDEKKPTQKELLKVGTA